MSENEAEKAQGTGEEIAKSEQQPSAPPAVRKPKKA